MDGELYELHLAEFGEDNAPSELGMPDTDEHVNCFNCEANESDHEAQCDSCNEADGSIPEDDVYGGIATAAAPAETETEEF
jgi:hypothetical protein